MSKYKRLGTARLKQDSHFAGNKGDVVTVIAYPDDDGAFSPARGDGSDVKGYFWAIPSASGIRILPFACIGKPGRDFEWASRNVDEVAE